MWHIIPDSFRTHWKDWEVRFLVLSSLLLQIILIPIGTRRKVTQRTWIQILVWITYLTAESVPILTLGVISNYLSNMKKQNATGVIERKYELFALWAPIVLIHLGGPDSITAYSLEDNEIWLRYFAKVFIQIGWTCYICFLALSSSPLSFIAIAIILIGILKNSERIWSMFRASKKEIRKSMCSRPRSNLFYYTLNEILCLRREEGHAVNLKSISEDHVLDFWPARERLKQEWPTFVASQLVETLKALFSDAIGNLKGLEYIKVLFATEHDSDQAFQIIDIELNLMFELLYTKAKVIYKPLGQISKIATLLLSVGVLLAFCMVDGSMYQFKLDLSITYVVILGHLISEIYSIFNLICMDSTHVLFIERESSFGRRLLLYIRSCCVARWLGITTGEFRWSESLGQFNLLSLAVHKTPKLFSYYQKIKKWYEMIKQNFSVTYRSWDDPLKRFIYYYLEDAKLGELGSRDPLRNDFTQRAKSILRDYDLEWVAEMDFPRFIVLWHVVTEITYHRDPEQITNDYGIDKREISRTLSNYLIYLLVQKPTMWPIGVGDDYYAHTLLEAQTYFELQSPVIREEQTFTSKDGEHKSQEELDLRGICLTLQRIPYETLPPESAEGGESKSVLFHAAHAAGLLRDRCSQQWTLISKIWMEALLCIAIHSSGDVQAKGLIYGGEFVTRVWLLMAHRGITGQLTTSAKIALTGWVLS